MGNGVAGERARRSPTDASIGSETRRTIPDRKASDDNPQRCEAAVRLDAERRDAARASEQQIEVAAVRTLSQVNGLTVGACEGGRAIDQSEVTGRFETVAGDGAGTEIRRVRVLLIIRDEHPARVGAAAACGDTADARQRAVNRATIPDDFMTALTSTRGSRGPLGFGVFGAARARPAAACLGTPRRQAGDGRRSQRCTGTASG